MNSLGLRGPRSRAAAEVLNAGVVGYVSRQELALFVARLFDLRPDVLVAFDGWNDLYDRYWWGLIVVVQPELGQTLDRGDLERRASERRDFDGRDRYWVHFPARYRQFRSRVVPALAAADVEVVDGSELLGRAAGSDAQLFVDAVHLSRDGYAQVADQLAARMSAWPPPPARHAVQ